MGKPGLANSHKNEFNNVRAPAPGKILPKSACQPSEKLRVATFVVSKGRVGGDYLPCLKRDIHQWGYGTGQPRGVNGCKF